VARRYWQMGGFDATPGERADHHESLREQMIEKAGFTPEQLAGAGHVLKAQHVNREPTAQNGMATPVIVNGEPLRLEESHVNSAGETVLTGYRRNGPRFERVHIRQAQAGPHTRIVTETY
jgi:hypothetical protein